MAAHTATFPQSDRYHQDVYPNQRHIYSTSPASSSKSSVNSPPPQASSSRRPGGNAPNDRPMMAGHSPAAQNQQTRNQRSASHSDAAAAALRRAAGQRLTEETRRNEYLQQQQQHLQQRYADEDQDDEDRRSRDKERAISSASTVVPNGSHYYVYGDDEGPGYRNGGNYHGIEGEIGGDDTTATSAAATDDGGVRHGFDDVQDEEQVREMMGPSFAYWTDGRHEMSAFSRTQTKLKHWRVEKRQRTAAAVLCLCLRIGYDPPDVIKTNPCAKLECWVDPTSSTPPLNNKEEALKHIARTLQTQFENLVQSTQKIKYKVLPDPWNEELRKQCISQRRLAKNDRMLLYYNGHGVPKPTTSGEIWVFNKQYTQYIPLSLYELMGWVGTPAIYIWDCSNAGSIVQRIEEFAARRDEEIKTAAMAQSQAQANGTGAEGGGGGQPGQYGPEGRPVPPENDPQTASFFADMSNVNPYPFRETIQLGACVANQTLPMNPDLPADLFTSCLTSPIEIALKFFILRNPLKHNLTEDMVFKVPGKSNDRRTMLGELSWILTAVTDTIAWNILPRELFHRLFRQDLLVAALFRGFLLAQRIMRYYDCTPLSVPAVPSAHDHPMWDSWDFALDKLLRQLPDILAAQEEASQKAVGEGAVDGEGVAGVGARAGPADPRTGEMTVLGQMTTHAQQQLQMQQAQMQQLQLQMMQQMAGQGDAVALGVPPGQLQPTPLPTAQISYQNSTFFAEQLTAFEVWLEQGALRCTSAINSLVNSSTASSDSPIVVSSSRPEVQAIIQKHYPTQLPIVLQVLLSQFHRIRALILLCKFLDLGTWAVDLALSIGIFPYAIKLLQSPSPDLKPPLIYVWARVAAAAEGCAEDLSRLPQSSSPSYYYFVNVLRPQLPPHQALPIPNVGEHRAMCAFVLSVFCQDSLRGQMACLDAEVLDACLHHLQDPDPLLRQWASLCVAQLWDDFDRAKGEGVQKRAHEKFVALLPDAVPEVRAAALFALGTLVGASGSADPAKTEGRSLSSSGRDTNLSPKEQTDVELGVAMATLRMCLDGSPLVRKELVVLLSAIVHEHQGHFVVAAYSAAEESLKSKRAPSAHQIQKDRQAVIDQSMRIAAEFGDEGSTNPAFSALMFSCIYKTLLDLSLDPFPGVAQKASIVVDFIHEQLLNSPLAAASRSVLNLTVDQFAPPAVTHKAHGANGETKSLTNGHHSHQHPSGTVSGAATPTLIQRSQSLASAFRHSLGIDSTSRPASTAPSTNHSPQGTSTPSSRIPSAANLVSMNAPRRTTSAESLSAITGRHGIQAKANGSSHSHSDPEQEYGDSEPPALETAEVSIADATLSLLAADEERLRRRRSAPGTPVSEASSSFPSSPVASTLGDLLPLKSSFFAFSSMYFTEPQMRPAEADEPGSINYNERLWRRERNDKVAASSQALRTASGTHPWNKLYRVFNNFPTARLTTFHQYESHLATADDRGMVTVYDWEQNRRLSRFSNGDPAKGSITSLKFINEDDAAFLLTGSSDGQVRIFRNYDQPKKVELVTAFRALNDIVPTSLQEAGLVADWQQNWGHLLVSGNVKVIRVWDAPRENCIQEIQTRSNSPVTSLTSDQTSGKIIIAGFGDGNIRVFDRRLPAREVMTRLYKGWHQAWIQTVHMQRGGNRELVSGSLMGEVCLWDIRMSHSPIRKVLAHSRGGSCLTAVHDHAPIFATGSHTVKMWNMMGDEPFNVLTNTPHPVTSLSLHPHRSMLAAGGSDGIVNVYQCDTKGSMVR